MINETSAILTLDNYCYGSGPKPYKLYCFFGINPMPSVERRDFQWRLGVYLRPNRDKDTKRIGAGPAIRWLTKEMTSIWQDDSLAHLNQIIEINPTVFEQLHTELIIDELNWPAGGEPYPHRNLLHALDTYY